MHQNVTLKLDKQLLRQARLYAVGEGKSLSRLMKEALQTLMGDPSGYEKAQKRALQLLHKGLCLGAVPLVRREVLHSRHAG